MSTQQLAKIGMMSAVACVLGLLRFPLIPAVSFLTYDFADIPLLISAFAYGPVPGLLAAAVVCLIQAFMLGGDGIYGFIMHFISSGAFIIIAASIYKHHKSKKNAVISMIIATIIVTIIMGIANYFITPFYYGGAGMKEMVVELMPLILAFNVLKWTISSAITFVVYNRITPFLHKNNGHNKHV